MLAKSVIASTNFGLAGYVDQAVEGFGGEFRDILYSTRCWQTASSPWFAADRRQRVTATGATAPHSAPARDQNRIVEIEHHRRVRLAVRSQVREVRACVILGRNGADAQ